MERNIYGLARFCFVSRALARMRVRSFLMSNTWRFTSLYLLWPGSPRMSVSDRLRRMNWTERWTFNKAYLEEMRRQTGSTACSLSTQSWAHYSFEEQISLYLSCPPHFLGRYTVSISIYSSNLNVYSTFMKWNLRYPLLSSTTHHNKLTCLFLSSHILTNPLLK